MNFPRLLEEFRAEILELKSNDAEIKVKLALIDTKMDDARRAQLRLEAKIDLISTYLQNQKKE